MAEKVAPKKHYKMMLVEIDKEHAEAFAAVEALHGMWPSRAELLCMLPNDQRVELLFDILQAAVTREPTLVEAENRLIAATAEDKDYTKGILWYRKRRQEMLDEWKVLVRMSDAKNGAELSEWIDEFDRVNPGLLGPPRY